MKSYRYKLFLLVFVFLIFVPIQKTYAHESGPSYITINGINTILNVARAFAHNPGFTLGTDLAPENKYPTGTPIRFKVDQKVFFTPDNIPAQFEWDFQDGSPVGRGAEVTHTFQNPGSYFVNLHARYNENIPYTNADIVQINIVSSKTYPVPVAKIMVNGKLLTDFKQKESIILNKEIQFDASQSTGQDLRYYWEMGDGTRSRDKMITHKYTGSGESTFFPLLRVTDDQGIVNDSILTLGSSIVTPTPPPVFHSFLGSIWQAIIHLFK